MSKLYCAGFFCIILLATTIAPAHADMIIESRISGSASYYVGPNQAFVTSVIELNGVDDSVYAPISEAIQRFHPYETYYIFPNGPGLMMRRDFYNESNSNGAIRWFSMSLEPGIDVTIHFTVGDVRYSFPVFFNLSLDDTTKSMRLTVEIPDMDTNRVPRELVDVIGYAIYCPFLDLTEYPNGTDTYSFDRTVFDTILPNLREGLLGILRSMTSEYTPGNSDMFGFDFLTPSAVIQPNGTTLKGISSIYTNWVSTNPYTFIPIGTYTYTEPVNAVFTVNDDRSSLITVENGDRISIPAGQQFIDINDSSNFTQALIKVQRDGKQSTFHVEDGTLWISVHDYLIWNGEEQFLNNLNSAIDKLGEAFTFNWLKTPLDQWNKHDQNETIQLANGDEIKGNILLEIFNKTESGYTYSSKYSMKDVIVTSYYTGFTEIKADNGTVLQISNETRTILRAVETQRNFILENENLMEIKTHTSLSLHSIEPWPYGDPTAYLVLPDGISDIKVDGDILTFNFQESAYVLPQPPSYKINPLLLFGTIAVVVSIFTIAVILIKKRKRPTKGVINKANPVLKKEKWYYWQKKENCG